MSLKVQKYLSNMGKSVMYTAADVAKSKFEYFDDFKDTNQEVFKSAYAGIKNYKTTLSRVKTAITHNKITEAAMVGMDSLVYSITTGDFYAKQREDEIAAKYSGEFMDGFDIDNDDFDWDNNDEVSKGEKTIATAIKKNSKISTAMISEAIVKTSKAQIDSNKDNLTILYTQNERMMSKLGGGLDNISNLLRQNAERNEKVFKQQNDNLNKFMTSVDNNVAKLTKQFDELLEMQRNIYKQETSNDNTKKKIGYNDIVSSNGVIDLKAYGKIVAKNTADQLEQMFPGMNMIFGDTFGKGTNMLAQFVDAPFRSLMTSGINLALGTKFDTAAKQLNDTMQGVVPTLLNKLVNTGEKGNGFSKILGKILGVKQQSDESINSRNYNKGAIPFDGITKRAITDVIPYYLRKMTSALTGQQEMIFDYNNGSWKTINSAVIEYNKIKNSGTDQAKNFVRGTIEKAFGRNFDTVFNDKRVEKRFTDAIDSLATKLYSVRGDFSALSDLSYSEEEILKLLKQIESLGTGRGSSNSRLKNGLGRSNIINYSRIFSGMHNSQNNAIKTLNEGNNVMIGSIDAEGLGSVDTKKYKGMAIDMYKNGSYDIDESKVYKHPIAKVLLHTKDEYSLTIFNYLRDIGRSLRYIDYNTGTALLGMDTVTSDNNNGNTIDITEGRKKAISNSIDGGSNNGYNSSKTEDIFNHNYWANRKHKDEQRERETREERISKYNKKNGTFSIDNFDFIPDSRKEYGTNAILTANRNAISDKYKIEKDKKKKKSRTDVVERFDWLLNSDDKRRLIKFQDEYDDTKSLAENFKNAKTFDEKLLTLGNSFSDKFANIRNKSSETMLKASHYIEELIFGHELKNGSEKESLVDHLKAGFKEVSDKFKDFLNDKWSKIRDKLLGRDEHGKATGPLSEIADKIFGEDNGEGRRTGGLLGNVINSFKDKLQKNSEEVAEWVKANAQKAKDKAKEIIENNQNSSSNSSDSNRDISNNDTKKGKKIYETKKPKAEALISSSNSIDKYTKIYISTLSEYETAKREGSSDTESLKIKVERMESILSDCSIFKKWLNDTPDNDIAHIKQWRNNIVNLDCYNNSTKLLFIKDFSYKRSKSTKEAHKDISRTTANNIKYAKKRGIKNLHINENITGYSKKQGMYWRDYYNDNKMSKNDKKDHREKGVKNLLNIIEKEEAKIKKIEDERSEELFNAKDTGNQELIRKKYEPKIKKHLDKIDKCALKIGELKYIINHMAYGGINLSNHSFRSVISAGEKLNGRKINSRGIYTIHPGDTVIPNNSASRRASDMKGEKNYLKIHTNANANDDLTPVNWDKDNKLNKVADVSTRGLLGGGIGLLAGGPILGALIGGASTFNKSSNAFSQAIFGDVVYESDGTPKYDEKGNIIRKDTGLISKEIQSAMPDIKKGALAGGIGGLLTPLGPLGGVIIGSALGFAKNTNFFKEELFGETGAIGKDKLDKLNKAKKNMGIGAAAGALFLPGPFGLIGSALIGSAAGYITAQDKFKEMIFGKYIDPENPEKGKYGGLAGAIKKGIEPLKSFGRNIVDASMDALFGKSNEDGKREGGLFGAIKENVVNPLSKFASEAATRLKLVVRDMGLTAKKTFNKIKNSFAGGNLIARLGQHGGVIGGGLIRGAGAVGKLATSPFRALGKWADKSKIKRIKKGQAYDMPASDRMALRHSSMQMNDDFSDFDRTLLDADVDSLKELRDEIGYAVDKNYDIDAADRESIETLKERMTGTLRPTDLHKVIKLAKSGNLDKVKSFLSRAKSVTGEKLSDQEISSTLDAVQMYSDDRGKTAERLKNIKSKGRSTAESLRKNYGLNIDINNEKQVDRIKRMLNKEISHKQSGITDDEKKRNNIIKSLDPVNKGIDKTNSFLERICSKLDWFTMDDKEKSKYDNNYTEYYKQSQKSIRQDSAAAKVKKSANRNSRSSEDKPSLNEIINDSEGMNNLKASAKEANDVFINLLNKSISELVKGKIDNVIYQYDDDDVAKDQLIKKDLTDIPVYAEFVYRNKKYAAEVQCTVDYNPNAENGYGNVKIHGKNMEDLQNEFIDDWLYRVIPKDSKVKNYKSLFSMIKTTSGIGIGVTMLNLIGGLPLVYAAGAYALFKTKTGKRILGVGKKSINAAKNKAKNFIAPKYKKAKYHLGSHALESSEKQKDKNDKRARKILDKKMSKKYSAELDTLSEGFSKLSEDDMKQYENTALFNEPYHAYCYKNSSIFREEFDRSSNYQIGGRGLLGSVKQIFKLPGTMLGGIKSGIKNAVAGKLESAKEKRRNGEDGWQVKMLDKLDAIKNATEKSKLVGSEGRLKKIFKWVFAGGIAAPLIVGFFKKKFLPKIKDTIGPWIGDKLKSIFIGKDNERPLENSIVGKIIYPITDFFKDKFQKVHDWFTNSGDYSAADRGMSGLLMNLKSMAGTIIDYWKEGFSTIYQSVMPKVLENFGYGLVKGVGAAFKGVGHMIGDIVTGQYGKTSAASLEGRGNGEDARYTSTSNNSTSSISYKYPWTNTVTGTINVPGSIGDSGSNSNNTTQTVSFDFASSFPNMESKVNSNGTATYTGSNGKSFTTRNYSSNEVYMSGTTTSGVPIYKAVNGDNVMLKYDESSGQYIPIYDYDMAAYDDYNVQSVQEYADKEKNGELNYFYDRQNDPAIIAGSKLIGGQSLRQSARIIGGMQKHTLKSGKVAKLMIKAGDKTLGNVPVLKYGWKVGKGIGKVGYKATNGLTDVTVNKAYKMAQSRITKKATTKTTESVAKSAATSSKSGFMAKLAKLAEKAIGKLDGFINSFKDKLSNEIVQNVERSAREKAEKEMEKATKKGFKEILDKIFKSGSKETEEKIIKEGAEGSVKSACASTGIGLIINAAIIAWDFARGIDDCRNILGIVKDNPTFIERILGGYINVLQDIPYVGIVFGILLGIDEIRGWILDLILPIFAAVFKPLEAIGITNPFKTIIKDREEAEKAIANYNEKNNASVTISEYNSIMGNDSIGTKIWNSAKNGVSSLITGKDSGISDSMEDVDTSNIENNDVINIKEEMSDVISAIWEQFGKDDFNHNKCYDADGKELSKKKRLNSNKERYKNCTKTILTKTITFLDGLSFPNRTPLKDACSNLADMHGLWDSRTSLHDSYNKYYENPEKIVVGLPDNKMYAWKRVRAMAGFAGVFYDCFAEPIGTTNASKIVGIILSAMSDAYFTESTVKSWGKSQFDDSSLTSKVINNNTIRTLENSTADKTPSKFTNDINTLRDQAMQKYSNRIGTNTTDIATNAEANNGLTPFDTSSMNMGQFLASNINRAMDSIGTGKSITDIFAALTEKNRSINDKIDKLELLPTDDQFWNIELDDSNPYASALFRFTESISRTVKAPFALIASPDSLGNAVVQSAKNDSNNSNNSNKTTTKSSTKKNYLNIANRIKSLFGKGNDDKYGTGSNDGHIYQRDYSSSYNTSGDTEHQTLADSGCGPAAAATLLRMYGKDSNMNSAASYALHNNYKEIDGGTYPEYFGDYLGKNGISTNSNASNTDVVNNLIQGKPVILMGRNTNGGNAPYGSDYSHYVVAKGLDNNGNVIVDDSEDRQGNTKYSLSDTLNNTSVRITTGMGRRSKFGRANDDNESLSSRFIGNVTNTVNSAISTVIGSAMNSSIITSSSSSTNTGLTNNNGVTVGNNSGTVYNPNATGNASAAIGKSLTRTENGHEFSMSITQDEVDVYNTIVNAGISPAVACGCIGNFEVECGVNRLKEVATQGVINYGGGIMQWTDSGEGNPHLNWVGNHPEYASNPWSWDANLAHMVDQLTKGNASWNRCTDANPSLSSKGFTECANNQQFLSLTDPADAAVNYERAYEGSYNWNGITSENARPLEQWELYDFSRRQYAILAYDLIVNGKSDSFSGSGRGKVGKAIKKFISRKPNKVVSGRSKFGRATSSDTSTSTTNTNTSNNESLISKVSNYTNKIGERIFGTDVWRIFNGDSTSNSTNNNQQNNIVSNTINSNNTTTNGFVDIDAATTIICGDSITQGLFRTPIGERALGVVGGTTDPNYNPKLGYTYESVFKKNSDIISKATDVIFFWGMNEIKTGLSFESYAEQYKNSINTILGYANKKPSDVNIYIMSVITVPNDSVYTSDEVKNFNDTMLKPFAQSNGYAYIDIFEASNNVPHESGNVHPSDWNALYEVIKAATSSGSGRSRIRRQNKLSSNKIGRSKFGRADSTTSNNTASTNTTSSSNASLVTSVSNYATDILKHMWGTETYNAIFGDSASDSSTTNTNSNTYSINSDTPVYANGSYRTWIQSDPKWKDKELGDSGETMEKSGCAVTAQAILAVHSGAVDESQFDPGVAVDYLSDNGGFDGNGNIYWDSIEGLLPKFSFEKKYDINHSSKQDVINALSEALSQGYFIELYVGGHWVAIDKIQGDTVYMIDPAQNTEHDLFKKYNIEYMETVCLYKGPNSSGSGMGKRRKHRDPLRSYDAVRYETSGYARTNTKNNNSNTYYSNSSPILSSNNNRRRYSNSSQQYSSYNNSYESNESNSINTSGTVNLNSLLNLVNVIANNSDKINDIITLLSSISSNTEPVKTSRTQTAGDIRYRNGLSGLNTILNQRTNGQDVEAVYDIAKS